MIKVAQKIFHYVILILFFSNFHRYGFNVNGPSQNKKSPEQEIEIIRRREMKWLAMLDHWDKYMLDRFKKVRQRCRKGVKIFLNRFFLKLIPSDFLMFFFIFVK